MAIWYHFGSIYFDRPPNNDWRLTSAVKQLAKIHAPLSKIPTASMGARFAAIMTRNARASHAGDASRLLERSRVGDYNGSRVGDYNCADAS
jgi:hypothetical protein